VADVGVAIDDGDASGEHRLDAAGCLVYDMGDARPGSSLARFKENLGARLVRSPAYYRERLPITAADRRLRASVKRLIGFRDA
jgi:hypothetical protein